MLHPLFQDQWDRYDQYSHQTWNYLMTGHHLYSDQHSHQPLVFDFHRIPVYSGFPIYCSDETNKPRYLAAACCFLCACLCRLLRTIHCYPWNLELKWIISI